MAINDDTITIPAISATLWRFFIFFIFFFLGGGGRVADRSVLLTLMKQEVAEKWQKIYVNSPNLTHYKMLLQKSGNHNLALKIERLKPL